MKRSACALAVFALLASGCDDEKKPSASKHAPADVQARADEVYAWFRTMFDNLPAPTATPMKCPDDKIAAWTTEQKKQRVTYLSYQSLRHTLEEPWLGNSVVGYITDSNVRYPPPAKLDLTKERNIKQLMRMWNFVEYVGVVVPTEEREAKATSEFTGDGGALKGQLVVYRKGEPEPICHTPFSATGPGSAKYRHKDGANSNDRQSKAQHALNLGLRGAIKTELRTQLGTISTVLTDRP